MLFICICKLGCLSWPGHSWKRDFNLSESFSWLNKGIYKQGYDRPVSVTAAMTWLPLQTFITCNIEKTTKTTKNKQ